MGTLALDSNLVFDAKAAPLSALVSGFVAPYRRVWCIALKRKADKGRVFNVATTRHGAVSAGTREGASTGLIDEGLMDREFEFRPAFDEYVKAMESVRIGKDNEFSFKGDGGVRKDDKIEDSDKEEERRLIYKSGSTRSGRRVKDSIKYSGDEIAVSPKDIIKFSDFRKAGDGVSRKNDVYIARENSRNKGLSEGNSTRESEKYVSKWVDAAELKSYASSAREHLQPHGNILERKSPNRVVDKNGPVDDKYLTDDRINISAFKWEKEKRDGRRMDRGKGNGGGKLLAVKDSRTFQVEDTEKYEKRGRHYISNEKTNRQRHESQVLEEDNEDDDVGYGRKAFETFEEFTDVRNRPRVSRMEMEERIQKLAKWLNGTDINLPEWQFSKMMHSAKIKFSDHSILRVVQILGALGNWKRALQVVEWLRSRERFKSYKSKYIYTTLLNVLGKTRRPVEALNIFHAMRKESASYPDMAAYHCIAVTLGQAGHLKELFDVIDCMKTPPKKFNRLQKLDPDAVVYNALLNACVHRKQWEGAFWVLQQLKEKHLQPSSTTYGLVMEVMFACEKYNLVHEFFRKVEKNSIPNALNYKVLVNTLWKEGKPDDAVSVVKDMERRGIVGSASLYYDLARCLCSAGRPQEALNQVEKICKVATKPLVVTFTGLIQACLESGNVEDGSYIFRQMHKFCSPNLVTYNIMLKAYVEHKRFEEAKNLFAKIIDGPNYISSLNDCKERIIPDNYTFNTMLEACVAENNWADFATVYKQMLHHGYPFNVQRHLHLVMEASRAGQGEPLEATWNQLVQSGRVLPPPIIKARFCRKVQEGEIKAAVACIPSHHTKHLFSFSKRAWLDLLVKNAKVFQKGSIESLVQEISYLLAKNELSNPIFENLLSSCKEYIDNHS